MTLSRRGLIQLVGRAGGAGATYHTMAAMGLLRVPEAYAGPPQLPPGKGRRIVIIGAGIAGMVLAWELRKAGYTPLILEARLRPGGRNWSLRRGDSVMETDSVQRIAWDAGPHMYFNPGPARLPYHHTGILSYCRELDVPLEVMSNDSRGALLQSDAAFDGKPTRFLERKPEEERNFRMLGLLTSKPVLYVCNVEESSAKDGNSFSKQVFEQAKKEGAVAVVISAKIESEIATLSREERTEFLETLGLEEAGLDRLIRAGYQLLDLITYFTVGPKEARAWTIDRGTKAPGAAGVIHTDFEKGFIRAETIAYDDYVTLNGEAGARDAGKLRLEGKEYIVADGDVMHFRFNT